MSKLNDKLTSFLSEKIEPRLQRKKIKNAQTIVREIVAEHLAEHLEQDFLMGSYSRHTLIRKQKEDAKYDVDIMFILAVGEDLESLLDLMEPVARELVEKIDDAKSYRRQKVSIGLLYDDDFSIDMVPGLRNEEGDGYIIYDRYNLQSIHTDPQKHNAIISDLNSKKKELLIPLIKLIKRWKQERASDTLKSFHLEMLASNIFQDAELPSLLEGLSVFFKGAYTQIQSKKALIDPVGRHDISEYLDALDNPQRENAIRLLKIARDAVEDAVTHEQNDDSKLANRAMGRIYEYFSNTKEDLAAQAISSTLISNNAPKPWGSADSPNHASDS